MRLIETDGLGGMRKKIDGRGATEAKSFFGNVELEGLLALAAFEAGNEKDNLDTRAKTGSAEIFETVQIDEEEFLWEMKIFLEKPVTRKGRGEDTARVLRHR